MSFGARLREKREKKGLTQEALGKCVQTYGRIPSKSVVYGWESRGHFPRVDELILICAALDTTADYLVLGKVSDLQLTPETAEAAKELDSLLPKQREWALREAILPAIKIARSIQSPQSIPQAGQTPANEGMSEPLTAQTPNEKTG